MDYPKLVHERVPHYDIVTGGPTKFTTISNVCLYVVPHKVTSTSLRIPIGFLKLLSASFNMVFVGFKVLLPHLHYIVLVSMLSPNIKDCSCAHTTHFNWNGGIHIMSFIKVYFIICWTDWYIFVIFLCVLSILDVDFNFYPYTNLCLFCIHFWDLIPGL